MAIPAGMLQAAARALAGDAQAAAEAAPLLRLLAWGEVAAPDLQMDRTRLMQAATGCLRVFQLSAPDAPGLHAFGAEIDLAAVAGETGLPIIGASGVGAEPGAAFAACIAEAVEFLAQVETPAQRQVATAAAEVTLRRWPDGAARRLPLDRCLRRASHRVQVPSPAPLSIGCAAGRRDAEAVLHAALELMERDAAALWWRGGRPGRPLPLEASAPAAALLARLRQGSVRRLSWLLDITTEFGVPSVAAISLGAEGNGFCCGTASRAQSAEAACAAVLELCQNELAYAVVLEKAAQGGQGGLNPRDRAMLRRHAEVLPLPAWVLHPTGAPRHSALPGEGAEAQLAALSERLEHAGFELLLFPHREAACGVPVWRAVCEGLACEPSGVAGARLERAMAETGGGPGLRTGIPLYI